MRLHMLEVDWMNFWNNFDFDALVEAFTSGSWKWIFKDRVVRVAGVLLLALIIYEGTRNSGVKAATWIPVGLFYCIGVVIVKNSVISEPGPFVLLTAMFLLAAGYFMAKKLLQS